MLLVNILAVRIVPLLSAVDAATYAEHKHLGFFNTYNVATILEYLIVLLLLDMMIYWQHFAFHHIPFFWRFHRVHHADHDLDASSGIRFHPVEIVFSTFLKCIGILLLGAPTACVILFEIILNCCALFNHSNLRLPLPLDRFLRCFIVTPDMHRIHHSIHRDETELNYGFNIAWWDRIFGTYKAHPIEPHEQMRLGVPEFPMTEQTVSLWSMLKMPFTKLPKGTDVKDPSLNQDMRSRV